MSGRINIGDIVEVQLKKEKHSLTKCVYKKRILVSQINEAMAQMDTGYNRTETINIIKRMYHRVEDIENKAIYFYVLKKIKNK